MLPAVLTFCFATEPLYRLATNPRLRSGGLAAGFFDVGRARGFAALVLPLGSAVPLFVVHSRLCRSTCYARGDAALCGILTAVPLYVAYVRLCRSMWYTRGDAALCGVLEHRRKKGQLQHNAERVRKGP